MFNYFVREFSLRNFVTVAATSERDLHKLKGRFGIMNVESERGNGRLLKRIIGEKNEIRSRR